MQRDLENEANRLIAASGQVKVEMALPDRVIELLGNFPAYLPAGSEARMVNVGGVWCPCGGTHVRYFFLNIILFFFMYSLFFVYLLKSNIFQLGVTNW